MESYYAIGLMSGTSLDGLDICYVKFKKDHNWHFEILASETYDYSETWENLLRSSFNSSAEYLCQLNSDYGFYLGEQVLKFRKQYDINRIDVIASHGHTVFHRPEKKFTTQIGDGRAIKLLNEVSVVYDFRSQDVLLGGNGAPLVPIGDELLFPQYDACINLGGFSNISLLHNHKRIAFDICPVNIVLNNIAGHFGQKYDRHGAIAANGHIIPDLLDRLNALEFYKLKHPRSLGVEWVNESIFPIINQENKQDVLATFTQHVTDQILQVLKVYELKRVLFTGGGTYNRFLMENIKKAAKAQIIIPDPEIIDFKEALIFALMGVLRLRDENNILSSATGSFRDHCSGILV